MSRTFLALAAFVLLMLSTPVRATAEGAEEGWTHAISLTGPPRYGADFKHPDYVNPQAPKGGKLKLGALGTFDNFNPFVSGVKGNLASHLLNLYESLLQQSLDEPTTEYGLLAEKLKLAPDHSWVIFRLREEARWHDGRRITADDVRFSFEAWRKLSPQWNQTYRKVAKVEVLNERDIRFAMSEAGDPALPLYLGQMPILPRHYWQGKDANGRQRSIETTTLEIPLGSGPYRLSGFVAGRSLRYVRVKNYWGGAVPIRVGTDNFDILEIDYFRDATVLFEAFKNGSVDFRRENSSKTWAVGYDNEAATVGQIQRETHKVERLGILRAFVFNQRRPLLQDLRIRRALALAYNFSQINKALFYGELSRPLSYFPSTDFVAAGRASEAEQKLAETLATETGTPLPTTLLQAPGDAGTEQQVRDRLRRALMLLKEAGYNLVDGRLVNAKGEQMTLEIVLEDPAMERVASFYADQLTKLGIAPSIRLVDDVQYQNRMRSFDFDIAVHAWVEGHAPGAEVREYFASESADKRGTNNIGGLRDRFADALIEKLILSPDRDAKVAAGRLLDRFLRHQQIGIPISNMDLERIAYWNRFSRPATLPRFGGASFPSIWWYDAAKDAKLPQK